jgi:hypothetical protein
MNLNLHRACANCPFKTEGAIQLSPGRLEQIASDLIKNDTQPFLCHKTVYGPKSDGSVVEHDDGTTSYKPGSRDSVCAGSMAFLLKAGTPNVAMRMGAAMGMLKYSDILAHADEIIDPQSLTLNIEGQSDRRHKQNWEQQE